MNTCYWKIMPRVINYRDYRSFSNERFRESLLENLKGKLSENSDKSFRNFINTCNAVLNKQLSKKKKSMFEAIDRFLSTKLCLKQLC